MCYDRGLSFSFTVGSCPGYLDTFKKSSPTIRSNNCQLFLTADKRSGTIRCFACSSYRSTLIVQHQRFKSRPQDDESTHATHITYGCVESIEKHVLLFTISLLVDASQSQF